MTIYQDIILDHYRSPHNTGSLSNPTSTIDVANSVCGDKMKLDIKVENNIVSDIKFSGYGCAIFMASSSLLTDYAKHKKKKDLLTLDTEFIVQLLGVELSPNRLKCALLPLEALQKVLQNRHD